ncbi:hypothetical protein [Streptomyces sp. S.PNR 29]|uniref:hypothetical protein n=1 Tax=Streptomyces sp. S.PNR 29 TaxID=2973805 RepID=UPI0025AFB4D9|nr:hypothetical protein [Streptomyces sp. S.PNR 29]MDN0193582.1 NYN domain-containing protein [Streptomyces sp. S.PNR 29]
MSTEARRVASVLLSLLLLTLPNAAAARAADGHSPSPGERIAHALRRSPVYVDAAYTDAVPPPRQRQLAEQIARTGLPIKVVLTPLTKGDDFNGNSDNLAAVVHDRLDLRNLILITTDGDFPDSLDGYEWPADTHETRDAVAAAGFLDETRDAGLADLTAKAVELVAQGDGTRVYEEATRDLDGPAPERSPSEGTRWWLWPLAAVPLLGLLTLVVLRSRRPRRAGLSSPHVVFAAARAADEAELRRRAEAEVLTLGEATRSANCAETPGLERALDAYAAAGTVLDAARGIPDLAGVLALVTEGHNALSSAPSPLPLCFFNPLHGRATERITWRPLGHRDHLNVAACPQCTHAVNTRRAPEVLTDRAADGRTVPYFEIAGERSVWAGTGYGSLLRGGDSLAGRVGRGDFTRGVSRAARPT